MDEKTSRYLHYLKKTPILQCYYNTAITMINEQDGRISGIDETIFKTSVTVSGPILVSYIWWVLYAAHEKNIKKIYFLARDGKIMYLIAQALSEQLGLMIECRYLYCSRYVLRKPLYVIDQEEAFEKLCIGGLAITPNIVLERGGFTQQQKEMLYRDIFITPDESKQILTDNGLVEFRKKLKESKVFNKIMHNESTKAYVSIIDYFKQEGLFAPTSFALVDSGWIGSTQRDIRLLLEHEGQKATISGFYFGIYNRTSVEDGEYNCFYFSPNHDINRCIAFNNNLFECLCMANHGMTVGYKKFDGKIEPIFKEFTARWNEQLQLTTIHEFAKKLARDYHDIDMDCGKLANAMEWLVVEFMMKPSKLEVLAYGRIPFCDDSTELYKVKLAAQLTPRDLVATLVPVKVVNRFISKRTVKKVKDSLWIEGTIRLLNRKTRWVFLINHQLLNLLKRAKLFFRR